MDFFGKHCNKSEIFFSDLKIVITDFFKPGFFVKNLLLSRCIF